MSAHMQFRAISGPAGSAWTTADDTSCEVRCGALGGTRTPNLLSRRDLYSHPLPVHFCADLAKCYSLIRSKWWR